MLVGGQVRVLKHVRCADIERMMQASQQALRDVSLAEPAGRDGRGLVFQNIWPISRLSV